MRVSIDPSDPGHGSAMNAVRAVLVNDIPLRAVITADEEEGFALAYLFDENGQPVYDNGAGCFATRIYRGKVEIVTRVH